MKPDLLASCNLIEPMKRDRLDILTSFRFFAAALIVLAHTSEYFQIPDVSHAFQLTQGVSFFFVLSGFILAYNYDTGKRSALDLRSFYLSRFARIWPAHVASFLLFFALVANPFGDVQSTAMQIVTAGANLLLVHAWIPTRGFFFCCNAVSWSLSTELALYLLFPALIRRPSDRLPWGALLLSIVLAAIFIAIASVGDLPVVGLPFEVSLLGLLSVNPLVRVFEFCLGIFACALCRRRTLRSTSIIPEFAALSIVAAAMCLFSEKFNPISAAALRYYLLWSGAAIPFAYLILVFAQSKGPITRVLSHRALIYLGEISFCLYLVHKPLLYLIAQHQWLDPSKALSVTIYWAACILSAILMHGVVERPVRRWLMLGSKRQGLKAQPNATALHE